MKIWQLRDLLLSFPSTYFVVPSKVGKLEIRDKDGKYIDSIDFMHGTLNLGVINNYELTCE